MALNIQKANEIGYPLRMLVYGDSGAGKTHLAMQAHMVEGMFPALMVSCDLGTATARRTDIDVHVLQKVADISEVAKGIKSGNLPYKTVIIDGFSQFYDTLVLSRSGGDVPQIQDWMKSSFDAKKIIRAFVRLGTNIIVTSLSQKLQEEATGAFYTVPMVPGKMAWRIAEAFDIVAYLSVKPRGKDGTPTRILQVQPFRRVIAKDRDATLGASEVDITWVINSGKPPPMQMIWSRWVRGQPDSEPVRLEREADEVSPDDMLLYEAGDNALETTEGGVTK
jgi:hypothetical protein